MSEKSDRRASQKCEKPRLTPKEKASRSGRLHCSIFIRHTFVLSQKPTILALLLSSLILLVFPLHDLFQFILQDALLDLFFRLEQVRKPNPCTLEHISHAHLISFRLGETLLYISRT